MPCARVCACENVLVRKRSSWGCVRICTIRRSNIFIRYIRGNAEEEEEHCKYVLPM